MTWQILKPLHLDKLLTFLKPWEACTAHFHGLLWESNHYRFPQTTKALIWGFFDSENILRGVVGLSGKSLLLPCFEMKTLHLKDLTIQLQTHLKSQVTLLGPSDWVRPLEEALKGQVYHFQEYHLMERHYSEPLSVGQEHPESCKIRKLGSKDLKLYIDLQANYEKEEVMIHPQDFQYSVCSYHFEKALRSQIILGLEIDKTPVAKVGTNSISQNWAQLGGVYTDRIHRRRGLATLLMVELLHILARQRKSTCLFVKPENQAARLLYRHLGFKDSMAFRISYLRST